MTNLQQAMDMLGRFERGDNLIPQESGQLISNILCACGHVVTEQGFAESDVGVDCFFESDIDGRRQRIAVEVKFARQPANVQSVVQALRLQQMDQFDRTMVVSRSGFTARSIEMADEQGAGKIDLFAPTDLRNWLSKYAKRDSIDQSCVIIIREAMQRLALRLAEHPEELAAVEWRDLERILRETFEGLGYQTTLTRSGKDGGFDLELVTSRSATPETFLVEVKHWTTQKPGLPHLNKLVRVAASRKASVGLLLSTSGFAKTVYSGLADFDAPIRLGAKEKVIALCDTYYRLGSGLWLDGSELKDALFSGTTKPGSIKSA